jgi:hypothetical protein
LAKDANVFIDVEIVIVDYFGVVVLAVFAVVVLPEAAINSFCIAL